MTMTRSGMLFKTQKRLYDLGFLDELPEENLGIWGLITNDAIRDLMDAYSENAAYKTLYEKVQADNERLSIRYDELNKSLANMRISRDQAFISGLDHGQKMAESLIKQAYDRGVSEGKAHIERAFEQGTDYGEVKAYKDSVQRIEDTFLTELREVRDLIDAEIGSRSVNVELEETLVAETADNGIYITLNNFNRELEGD